MSSTTLLLQLSSRAHQTDFDTSATDTIYTERYMDTPEANPGGYTRSDLTVLAEKLRGKKYLLVHGTGDDNVHYQHSMQLAKKLQHSDIAFEQIVSTHNI